MRRMILPQRYSGRAPGPLDGSVRTRQLVLGLIPSARSHTGRPMLMRAMQSRGKSWKRALVSGRRP